MSGENQSAHHSHTLPDVSYSPNPFGGNERTGRRAGEAVGGGVDAGELALEHVHPVLATGLEVLAPREALTVEAASSGELPLRFGRQTGSAPAAVGHGVVPRDVHDGMVGHVGERRVGTGRVAPVGAVDLAPPRRRGDGAGGREVVGQQAAEHERPAVGFGEGDVAGGVTERGELGVGDGRRRDRERRELHLVDGTLTVGRVAVAVSGAHPELAAR